jgi:hypothetical protein
VVVVAAVLVVLHLGQDRVEALVALLACRRYRSSQLESRSKTSASRWHGRRCASFRWLTRPASASTLTCLDTAWIETS